VPQALSFGYFSLGKQRKVTRAAQPIGSSAVRSAHALRTWIPAFAGMAIKNNGSHEGLRRQDGAWFAPRRNPGTAPAAPETRS
jgi:hypothetical protein